MPRAAIARFCAPIVLVLAACSSSSSPAAPVDAGTGDGTLDDAPVVSCDRDPRVDTYGASLTKKSPSGALSVTLVSASPAPPALRTNTWSVRLVDASGAPVTNANLSVVPFMPDHGHGSSVVPTIKPGTDGQYEIDGLYFFMPGVWRVSIAAAPEGGASLPADTVDFVFCVEG